MAQIVTSLNGGDIRFAPLNEPASQERAARGAGGADEVTR
jgi:hypothetical protein